MKTRSLRTRIIVNFCLFTLFISVMFSLFNFLFLYSVEDIFLLDEMNEEVQFLEDEYAISGQWNVPRKQHIKVYLSADDLPADLRDQFKMDSDETEFYGQQGRHYHLLRLGSVEENIFLVAEVSQRLIIRPIRNAILIFFGIATLIMTLVSWCLAYWIAGKTISPLTHLANLVKGTQPSQLPKDFSGNYPENEIGILAQALEQSLSRIESFIDREKHFNRDVSHDLRTPIAIVQGGVELIINSPTLSEDDQILIARIEAANRQMSQIVQTLLELAREEHTISRSEDVRLLPMVEKTIVEQVYILKDNDIAVNVNIQPEDTVTVSPNVLQILLLNLISNAFQHTEAGQIDIELIDNNLSISNTAKGLASSMLGSLVKGAPSQGFGLGLSIVKRLCEHHHLKLEIREDGTGVCILIQFPKKYESSQISVQTSL